MPTVGVVARPLKGPAFISLVSPAILFPLTDAPTTPTAPKDASSQQVQLGPFFHSGDHNASPDLRYHPRILQRFSHGRYPSFEHLRRVDVPAFMRVRASLCVSLGHGKCRKHFVPQTDQHFSGTLDTRSMRLDRRLLRSRLSIDTFPIAPEQLDDAREIIEFIVGQFSTGWKIFI